ncbi:MAG: HupE/UreJ family protein [Planctomycetes bacterium]|nr:HupE/UreJ family protein [Planctomycetota bacterium]
MKKHSFTFALLGLAALTLPRAAFAHPGHDVNGFATGLAHPVAGLDHILAMVAVGLWAAQMGGRAVWAIPAAFVGVMVCGGALGMAGVEMPFVESGILASVLVLGLLIAAAAKLPLYASLPLVGVFALCHGHAHGAEMAAGASSLDFSAGFVIATAGLHLAGLGLGALLKVKAPSFALRAAGGAVAAGAVLLWAGAL